MMLPASRAAAQTLPRPSDPPGAANPAPCMVKFFKLREDVQQRGLAARTAGQRKVSREEICKHITDYSVAEPKWVKYAEANVTSCGISSEAVAIKAGAQQYRADQGKDLCRPHHEAGWFTVDNYTADIYRLGVASCWAPDHGRAHCWPPFRRLIVLTSTA